MDKQKLHGKIVEKYGTQWKFAKEVLGISSTHLSVKIAGDSWSLSQIAKTADALGLTPGEIYDIFFADEVGKYLNQQA